MAVDVVELSLAWAQRLSNSLASGFEDDCEDASTIMYPTSKRSICSLICPSHVFRSITEATVIHDDSHDEQLKVDG